MELKSWTLLKVGVEGCCQGSVCLTEIRRVQRLIQRSKIFNNQLMPGTFANTVDPDQMPQMWRPTKVYTINFKNWMR